MNDIQPVTQLYGATGYGSAIIEIIYTLAGEPYQLIDVNGFEEPGSARNRLLQVNPLAQVPALQLPDGRVMTESAAIALQLLDRHPQLAPADRTRFYHLLIWLVANVYPTFTYGDITSRWTLLGERELLDSTERYRQQLWLWLESQITSPGPYLFGAKISLLDAYLAVMVAWRPQKAWFAEHTPKIMAIAQQVRELENIKPIIVRNEL
ncbi:glutathione S-transferase [Erwiniaceae bacterium BAC15a-03b]|uniref:Glutathione S-transferase n=1 Tax=Winslowiella arboricola TaxID=2978220 RepID=A0A9J6PSB8_9GAMM|nr:glutathione S-transferase [Winslowiella arboricola]MCU5775552.1 glutathione S-transferase [Winslowiella arboricola]MCU5779598.1 glutathione S-transferase [Winslowiella arboricola]